MNLFAVPAGRTAKWAVFFVTLRVCRPRQAHSRLIDLADRLAPEMRDGDAFLRP